MQGPGFPPDSSSPARCLWARWVGFVEVSIGGAAPRLRFREIRADPCLSVVSVPFPLYFLGIWRGQWRRLLRQTESTICREGGGRSIGRASARELRAAPLFYCRFRVVFRGISAESIGALRRARNPVSSGPTPVCRWFRCLFRCISSESGEGQWRRLLRQTESTRAPGGVEISMGRLERWDLRGRELPN